MLEKISRGFPALQGNVPIHSFITTATSPLDLEFFKLVTMTRFRPCIDLHAGAVKQIVGGSLDLSSASTLKTNFTSALPASHFATLYKENRLLGAHVIMLGPGNEVAAREALAVWPGLLQVGGGITSTNATSWMDEGAGKVGFAVGVNGLHVK